MACSSDARRSDAGNPLHPILQIAPHVEVRKQAGFLEHIAQRALIRRQVNPLAVILPDAPINLQKTAVCALQTGYATQ